MNTPADQFKINLNQNLWGLTVAFMGLGIAEHYALTTLFWFSVALSIVMVSSVTITTVVYTINYWNKKMGKQG